MFRIVSLHRSRFLSHLGWVLVMRGGALTRMSLSAPHSRKRPLPTFEKFHDTRPGALTRVSTVLFDDIVATLVPFIPVLNFRFHFPQLCPCHLCCAAKNKQHVQICHSIKSNQKTYELTVLHIAKWISVSDISSSKQNIAVIDDYIVYPCLICDIQECRLTLILW